MCLFFLIRRRTHIVGDTCRYGVCGVGTACYFWLLSLKFAIPELGAVGINTSRFIPIIHCLSSSDDYHNSQCALLRQFSGGSSPRWRGNQHTSCHSFLGAS